MSIKLNFNLGFISYDCGLNVVLKANENTHLVVDSEILLNDDIGKELKLNYLTKVNGLFLLSNRPITTLSLDIKDITGGDDLLFNSEYINDLIYDSEFDGDQFLAVGLKSIFSDVEQKMISLPDSFNIYLIIDALLSLRKARVLAGATDSDLFQIDDELRQLGFEGEKISDKF